MLPRKGMETIQLDQFVQFAVKQILLKHASPQGDGNISSQRQSAKSFTTLETRFPARGWKLFDRLPQKFANLPISHILLKHALPQGDGNSNWVPIATPTFETL